MPSFCASPRVMVNGAIALVLMCGALAAAGPERAAATTDCAIAAPPHITASSATDQAGAIVFYGAPTTSGTCLSVACTPASGAFYPLGVTLVTCFTSTTPIVRDSFMIRVNDTQAPTVAPPPDKTVGNDAGRASAAVTFVAPSVSDNAPGVTSACDHLSGSLFPLGSTTVTCTARDASGNTASAAFQVRVQDTEPPVIERAPDVAATVAGTAGPVTYTSPRAHDNSATPPGVSCTPASGTAFAVGSTTVTCTATDAAANAATATFSVVVTPAATRRAPVVQAAFFDRSVLRARRTGPRHARLSFVLNQPGKVTIAIDRCGAPPRKRATCPNARRAGTLLRTADAGLTTFAFRGILAGRPLAPGRYVATLTATDAAGRASKPRRVGFTIRR